jgi:hypothetical protein
MFARDKNFHSALRIKLYYIIAGESMKILSCNGRLQKAVGLCESHASSMPTANFNQYFVASVSAFMA